MRVDEKQGQTRRKFLDNLALAAAALGLGFSAQDKPKQVLATVKISENKDLEKLGGYALIKGTPAGDVLVVHSGDTQYTALSNVCPHKQCKVEVKSPSLIQCPCHQSAYKIDGTYIGGPSKTSLKKFTISQDGDVLTVSDSDKPGAP